MNSGEKPGVLISLPELFLTLFFFCLFVCLFVFQAEAERSNFLDDFFLPSFVV